MTFREPVFIGGRGNTSGLQEKLPTDHGFKGCIRHLQINDYNYKFAPVPKGDAVKGFDIGKQIFYYIFVYLLYILLHFPVKHPKSTGPRRSGN